MLVFPAWSWNLLYCCHRTWNGKGQLFELGTKSLWLGGTSVVPANPAFLTMQGGLMTAM